jgi:hypothetical protein
VPRFACDQNQQVGGEGVGLGLSLALFTAQAPSAAALWPCRPAPFEERIELTPIEEHSSAVFTDVDFDTAAFVAAHFALTPRAHELHRIPPDRSRMGGDTPERSGRARSNLAVLMLYIGALLQIADTTSGSRHSTVVVGYGSRAGATVAGA